MKKILLAFYISTFNININAQHIDSINISFNDLPELISKRNKQLLSLKKEIEHSQLNKLEAYSTFLTRLSYDFTYFNHLELQTVLLPGIFFGKPNEYFPVKFGQQYQENSSFKIQQLVFNIPALVGIKLMSNLKDLSEYNYNKNYLDLLKNVKTLYVTILILEKIKTLLDSNIINLQNLYTKTEAMVSVGVLQTTDLEQINLNIINLNNTKYNISRNLEISYNLLSLLLDLDTTKKIILQTPLELIINDEKVLHLIINEFNIYNLPDYQLVKKQENISKLNLLKEIGDCFPTLSIFYNYTKTGQGNDYKNLNWYPSKVVGFSISIPIFNGFSNDLQIKKAKTQYEKSKLTTEYVTNQLIYQEKQLKFSLENSYNNLKAQKQALELSHKIFSKTEQKFVQGLSSSLELTQTHTNYINAQISYYNTLMELCKIFFELEKIKAN